MPDTLHYQLAGIQHVELCAEQEEEAFNGMLGALQTCLLYTSDAADE